MKITLMSCHFATCMYGKLLQLRLILCNPVDRSLPGSFVHGIFQARILEGIAMTSSRGPSLPRDWTCVSCIAGRFFNNWANREYSITWSSSYEQRGFIIWIWGVGNNTVHSSGWDGNKHVVLGQLIKDSCALLRSLGHFHCQQGAGIGIK